MIIELIVYGLATWRISSLLVDEGGPWDMFLHIRELAGIEHDGAGNKTIIPDGFFAGLLSCIWCTSLWVALGWEIVDWLAPTIAIRLGMVFALSAAAIFLKKLT